MTGQAANEGMDTNEAWVIDGVLAAGLRAGIKVADRPDLALLSFPDGATWTATLTGHALRAAPVRRTAAQLAAEPRRPLRAVLVNAGNANACTGPEGVVAAGAMAEAAAAALACAPEEIAVASTGVIGVPLPVERIEAALPGLRDALRPDGWMAAAEAIRTTDAWPKMVRREIRDADGSLLGSIGGIAKGAGMIAPNMATMLAFLATDLALTDAELDSHLRAAVDDSFNLAIVDGDQSTNDTVLLAATGRAGRLRTADAARAFAAALAEVCAELARSIVRDGEGARRLAEIRVRGASDAAAAARVARAIGNSPLVKTAIYGGDPNWGRIAAAAGACGVPMREEDLTVSIGGVAMFEAGRPRPEREDAAAAAMAGHEVLIEVVVGAGAGQARVWASDLGHEYVTCNADYRT